MITSLRVVDFKSFADETLGVGPFTLLVGAHASGKSNIRDAFRFLHGIGRGYTLAEILGGKREWEGIRGAPGEVARLQETHPHESRSFAIELKLTLDGQAASYLIEVECNPVTGFAVTREELKSESGPIYRTVDEDTVRSIGDPRRDQYHWVRRAAPPSGEPVGGLLRSKPVLTQIFPAGLVGDVLGALEGMRFLELSTKRMREPSMRGATILGDSGEYLPSVLASICDDYRSKETLVSWIRELTPLGVNDFWFGDDPSGRVHLYLVENGGRRISADSVSDGTLRFLAILAALLGPEPAGTYFIEDIENGIHPNRLWLLLDLIERQTAGSGVQVIATTHSPSVLNLIGDRTFQSTSVVSRIEGSDVSVIRPVDGLPNAAGLRETQGLGRLHASGWMEDMLTLAAWDDRDERTGG